MSADVVRMRYELRMLHRVPFPRGGDGLIYVGDPTGKNARTPWRISEGKANDLDSLERFYLRMQHHRQWLHRRARDRFDAPGYVMWRAWRRLAFMDLHLRLVGGYLAQRLEERAAEIRKEVGLTRG
jgi:hypothetical protein